MSGGEEREMNGGDDEDDEAMRNSKNKAKDGDQNDVKFDGEVGTKSAGAKSKVTFSVVDETAAPADDLQDKRRFLIQDSHVKKSQLAAIFFRFSFLLAFSLKKIVVPKASSAFPRIASVRSTWRRCRPRSRPKARESAT